MSVETRYRSSVFERWEHGSNFYWPSWNDYSPSQRLPSGARFFGSGRVALGNLLDFGSETRGWRRLLVPSYYCEDVVESLRGRQVGIARYPCGPLSQGPLPDREQGDVLLRVDYFGWGVAPLIEAWQGDVIEDRTHDPLGRSESTADFVIASLRKTLPIPDGGICWSPHGHRVPEEPSPVVEHERAVMRRLAAMVLKRDYLLGGERRKEAYRALEAAAERAFLDGVSAPLSAVSRMMLEHFSVAKARAARGANFAASRRAMDGDPNLSVLGPDPQEAPAVAIVRVLEPGFRDLLRARLANEAIYAAILWPGPQDGAAWYRTEDADFASSTLAIHVDSRYQPEDMERAAHRMRSLAEDIVMGAG